MKSWFICRTTLSGDLKTNVNAQRNGKAQMGFIQYAQYSAIDLDVHHSSKIFRGQTEPLGGSAWPLNYGELSVHLKLDMNVLKRHMGEQRISFSTTENRYPRDTWLQVCTDAFLFNDEGGAGARICCDLCSFYTPIGAHSPHYDGEIELHCFKKTDYPLFFNPLLSNCYLIRLLFCSLIPCK